MSQDRMEPPSERERELLGLLSQGLSNKEIAHQLFISPNTVKVHLRNIYAKLNVRSRTEATMVAVQQGWVQVDLPGEKESTAVSRPPARPGSPDPGAARGSPRTLATWQRIYLIVAALLVALGTWLTWPRQVETNKGPGITDRSPQTTGQILSASSRWKNLAQMPTPRSGLAVVAYDGRIYAIAGDTPSGVSNAVQVYAPDADDWTRGADKPMSVTNVGAVVLGSKIHVPGGSTADGQVIDRLEVYDPHAGELGTWGTAQPMLQPGCAYAIAAYQDEMFLFGGWNGSAYVAESYRYDPIADMWHPLSPMPTRRGFAGAGVIGDRIYVVGGYDGKTELATCEVYNPHADTWAACPPMNMPRGGVGTAVIANTLYVIGGGWKSYLVENEYLIPDPSQPSGHDGAGTWQTFSSPLLKEWRNLGVAANETTLYAIGGWDGTSLSINQAYLAIYRLYLPSAMGLPGQ